MRRRAVAELANKRAFVFHFTLNQHSITAHSVLSILFVVGIPLRPRAMCGLNETLRGGHY